MRFLWKSRGWKSSEPRAATPDEVLTALRARAGSHAEDVALLLLARTGILANNDIASWFVTVTPASGDRPVDARLHWDRLPTLLGEASLEESVTIEWAVIRIAHRITTHQPVDDHDVSALPITTGSPIRQALAELRAGGPGARPYPRP